MREHSALRVRERTSASSGVLQSAGVRRAVLLASLITMVVAALISLRVGAAGISWAQFFHAYFHYRGTTAEVIVRSLRMPRVLIAIEVGAALAVAGALVQGLTRNPLADSGILGINAGAALLVVIGIAYFGARTPEQYVWFAFPGAALGTGLAFALGNAGRGRPTPLRLTLAGVITAILLGALTSGVVFLSSAVSDDYRFWAVGDVGGRTMSVFYGTAPFVAIGLALSLVAGRRLNVLGLGEDLAHSLGLGILRVRALCLVAVVLLAGSAVAAAGPIAFVGLAVPNAVRAVVGNDYRWIVPISAFCGATFVLVADILARVVVRPAEIETGIVISVIGAPIFILLISRSRLARL